MDWFEIAREAERAAPDRTDFTDKTRLQGAKVPSGGVDQSVLSVKSVLSARYVPVTDPDALLAHLRESGPTTYGAAASALGWGATRAWQAEARLRACRRVRIDHLGRMAVQEPAT